VILIAKRRMHDECHFCASTKCRVFVENVYELMWF